MLNEVAALGAPDHLREVLRHRIEPVHPPGIDSGIEDPQRRAIAVDVGGGIAGALRPTCRHAPDVLPGAAFQHPAEMPFAVATSLRSVLAELPHVDIPRSDEAAIKI